MASSSFQLLSMGGTSFNKRKFEREHALFNKGGSSSKTRTKGSAEATAFQSEHLPSELDFFASSDHTSSKPQQKSSSKRKRHGQEEVEDGRSETASPEPQDLPAPPVQKISLSGPEPLPHSFKTFDDFLPDSDDSLRTNLRKNGVHHLWGVQGAVAGALLDENNRDVMVIAPTGSGKTLSYLLPLMVRLQKPCRSAYKLFKNGDAPTPKEQGIRSVIILPTHELALQIYNEVLKLCEGHAWRTLLLEKSTEKAVIDSTKTDGPTVPLGIDILVATPERLHKLVDSGALQLQETRYLILDEADRLLGADFLPQIEPVVKACTHKLLQKCCLSATMEAGPEALAKHWLRDEGVRIVVGLKDAATTTVEQKLQFCGSEIGKLMALRNDISEGNLPPPALIFVQSIERADDLYKELTMDGLRVGVVHSNRTKAKREEAVRDFREGKTWVLIVTELMARGLDFKGVEVVVNYGNIANVMKTAGAVVEPWMLNMPKPSKNMKKARKMKPVERKEVGGGGKNPIKGDVMRKHAMIEASKKRKSKGQQANGKAAGAKISEPELQIDMDE
ncbi:hypothetical protein QFC19_003057 [Naganishia cerealis]|uniref:Uncharacterized protein n=1 Tax=Naganishia cerealis TaxID=610337 RepID=A0ACC2W5X6_9TREE|nr:hypothetical protein QFC19_003057 [Naganishia cerealis]